MHCVFFFIDKCGYCERVLPQVVEFFTARSIPLVIRKPTLAEQPAIPGYPALMIPRGSDKPILLVGTNVLEALLSKPELLNGAPCDRLQGPPTGDGHAGV